MHRSAPRLSRFPRVILLGAVAALAAPAAPVVVAQEGDGRGLATFGDRGLTSFGDRFDSSFGRRGLERFSDIPLAPMGGLEIPGPSEQRSRAARRAGRSSRPANHHPAPRIGDGGSTAASAWSRGCAGSVASLRGVVLPPVSAASTPLYLPPVPLPSITLDHRPALAALEESLRGELQQARARGDADVARGLARSLRD